MGVVIIRLLHTDMITTALHVPSEELDVFEQSPNLKHGGNMSIINLWIFSRYRVELGAVKAL